MVGFSRILVLTEHAIALSFVFRSLLYVRNKGISGILKMLLGAVVQGAKVGVVVST